MSLFEVAVIIAVVLIVLHYVRRTSSTRQRWGAGLARACEQCGTEHPQYATYCRRCGRPLA